MSLGEGQDFAGYTIVRRLGSGGMGEVYLAQHPRLPKHVALKLLNPALSAEPNFRERFLREADLSAKLWHPNIVGVHDRGEFDGRLWIAMDFVDGEDAAALLARKYPAGMPVDLVVSIVTAVASALDYLHKQGLLHRDVKPANIMLTDVDDPAERRILLTDFGIARGGDEVSGLTQTNMTVGTVAYSAPEQLKGEDIDGRADLYSLAATAYQLLTGSPLFPRSSPAAVIDAHLSAAPPSLGGARPELASLDPVLGLGLAKNPGDRFQRCGDFAEALAEQATNADPGEPFDETVFGPVPPPGPQPPHAVERPQADRRRPIILAGAAIGLGLVFLGAMLFGWKHGSAPVPETPAPTAAQATTSPRETTPPAVTVALPPSTITKTVIPVPTLPPESLTTRPQVSGGSAVIVGTCDEGGSCGVQQRVLPYNDAPRMYPEVLHDGTKVSVLCGTIGDARSSQGYGSSRVWFRLANGSYINSVYTSASPEGVPQC
ncbi:serine/threonine-protein kinase [Mycolicibacterium sp.]|uniref:serine/threonine-protein kinase n=1 Tax=Mycolicibacterium sp. TaxID=2320850 RepID=UPI0025DFECB1|nr:serine/threonine-protein kinase [Mycolicibacterium sp.]MCB9409359.1 serine/threonine protein kinase [Mycolicibacterium sp.]